MTAVETVQEVLESRARALARPVDQTGTAPTVEVLVVTVAGGSRYAFETVHVREVLHNEHLRRLPGGCGALLGLVPARGDVVPVADLGDLLGLPPSGAARSFVVVLDGPAPSVGLLVDEASDVVRLRADQLGRPARAADSSARLELGVTADGAVLLDAVVLMSDPRLTVPRLSRPAPSTSDPRQES